MRTSRQFFTLHFITVALPPICIDDALGKYRGIDKQKIRDGRNIYAIHSLWDTYRAANPLFTITQERPCSRYYQFISRVLPSIWAVAGVGFVFYRN